MKTCVAITNANPNANVAGKDMVPEQTFQVQKDHEAWLKWTRRRTPSSSFCNTVFTRNATHVGCLHVNQRCPHPLWRIYELFWTLVPWSSSRPNGQNSDDVMGCLGQSTVDPHTLYWFDQFALFQITPALLALFTHSQTFFKFLPSIFFMKIYNADIFACRFFVVDSFFFKRLNKQLNLNVDFVNSCKFE